MSQQCAEGRESGCHGSVQLGLEYMYHRGLMEAEAEILAMHCMKGAGLLDEESARYSRGYAQHWLGGNEFPETSARKVLKGTDAILRAGRLALTEPEE